MIQHLNRPRGRHMCPRLHMTIQRAANTKEIQKRHAIRRPKTKLVYPSFQERKTGEESC
jgi:hypothetical protein